ncbi:hypothetical protein DAI22_04g220400 [Oryza sativa Japonica Group]|nr:hypothetical protein DAI22_04g220400 [Oryza sativa Japonica Group]
MEEVGWPRSLAMNSKAGVQRRRGESSLGMERTATRSRAAEWRKRQTAHEESSSAARHLVVLLQLGQRLPALAAGVGVGLAVAAAQERPAYGGADDRALRRLWKGRWVSIATRGRDAAALHRFIAATLLRSLLPHPDVAPPSSAMPNAVSPQTGGTSARLGEPRRQSLVLAPVADQHAGHWPR